MKKHIKKHLRLPFFKHQIEWFKFIFYAFLIKEKVCKLNDKTYFFAYSSQKYKIKAHSLYSAYLGLYNAIFMKEENKHLTIDTDKKIYAIFEEIETYKSSSDWNFTEEEVEDLLK